jgi:uroporphyrinogen decarboxylase
MMDSKERVDRLFQGQRPDRVALHALSNAFNSVNAGYEASIAYTDAAKGFEAMLWTYRQYDWERYIQYCLHSVTAVMDFGGKVRMPEGPYEGALIVEQNPMQKATDFDRLLLPDPRTAGRIPQALEYARLQYDHGLPATFFSRSPFTFAANFCGLETFARWLFKEKELCRRLMDLALEHMMRVMAVWVEEFGPKNVWLWISSPSESNQILSPRFFQLFALPYHHLLHQRVRELGVTRFGFHICGDQNKNLPALAEAAPWPHPSLLSFGHEVDIEDAARYFPRDIIYGNIEPSFIQTASPQAVYDMARATVEKGKRLDTGFVLGTGCGLPCTVPPAKVFAVTKAVRDFGSY